MKIAVFSDSHGYSDKMINAITQSSPNMIIHLGDGEADVIEIQQLFPLIPLVNVKGNCDTFSVSPETALFEIGKTKIYITHGHIFSVKRSTMSLIEKAKFLGADIVMYGHTHIADRSMVGELHVINPGSCGYSSVSSYAEVTISDSGDVECNIVKL